MKTKLIISALTLFLSGTRLDIAMAQSQTIRGRSIAESTYNGSKYTTAQTHYDGFGRPIIQVAVEASPIKGGPSNKNKNIVQFTTYDCMGRADSISYLPYAYFSDYPVNSFTYSSCKYDQQTFYNNYQFSSSSGIAYDRDYTYSLTKYDKSPQGVVLEKSSPGAFYNANSPIGHPVKMKTGLNQATDSIKRYTFKNDSMICFEGWYNSDQLVFEETQTDQNSSTTVWNRTYKNEKGQVVATSVRATGAKTLITYNIYDDYDRPRCSLPPTVDSQITTPQSDFSWRTYRKYLHFMEYDKRGDIIREYRPGQEPIIFIYDKRHQVILSQDGNQRPRNKWTFTQYDDLGRVFTIDEVRSMYNTEAQLRNYFYTTRLMIRSYGANILQDHILLAKFHYGGYLDSNGSGYIPFSVPSYLAFVAVPNVTVTPTTSDTGLKIYEKTAILPNTSTLIERAYYYDDDGRIIQTVVKNQLGGITRISNKYDFTGNLLATHESRQTSASAVADIKTVNYVYDDFGRLLEESTRLNSSPEAVVKYKYDDLARCTETIYGRDSVLTNQLSYGLTGDLRSQNNEVFSHYVYQVSSPHGGYNFNGLIAETNWYHNGSRGGYGFRYTPYGQLSGVVSYSGPADNLRNVEKNITYDLSGNILTMQRTDNNASLINDYTYNYDAYQLTTLSDACDGSSRQFRYDANGNMKFDSQNNWNFQYNSLNLLERVTDSDSKTLATYSYLADGTKIEATNAAGNGYTYLGSLIYQKSPTGLTLEGTGFSAGRILKTASGYAIRYYVADYQGSIRSIVDEQGNILEQNDYYPFGSRRDNSSFLRSDNRWLYNSKESQEFANLNVLDYGARMYDPMIGRWFCADPAMQLMNPYVFCGNNPVCYIDTDGRIFWLIPVLAGIIGGALNVAANWDNIDGFWQGLTTFAVGAGAGVAAAFTGGSSIGAMMGVGALGGAVVQTNNSIVAQTGENFSDFNSIDWGLVGKQAGAGFVGGGLAAGAGVWAANSSMINGISSPLLKSAVASPLAAGAGHVGAGTTWNLFSGNSLWDAFSNSFEGIGTSMALGTGIGMASTAATSWAQGTNPLNGNKLNSNTSSHATERQITRGVNTRDITDALSNPLKQTEIRYDNMGRPSVQYIGAKATVVINPETGKIVTTWPTHTKLANKLQKF